MSASSAAATLETPILDSKRPTLLQQITEEGGYAFASMATLSAAGDNQAAEAAMEMAWEQLHSGPSHSVVPVWGDAYAMACLHVAKHHYSSGELKLAIRALDLGLIMGGLVLKDDLKLCAGKVIDAFRGKEICENGEGPLKGEWCKDFDLAELRILLARSLSCKTVEKKSGLSTEGFMQEHLHSGSPVIISDSLSRWPAKDRWNDINYLKKVAGFRTVPVKILFKTIEERQEQSPPVLFLSSCDDFHACFRWNMHCEKYDTGWEKLSALSVEARVDHIFLERIQSNDCSSENMTYLAQHQLFDQIQELKQDIVIPDYCFAGGGEINSPNAWFGPPGNVNTIASRSTPQHTCSGVGKKYVRLYPASLSEELYPHSDSMLTNSSQVNLDNIDDEKYPKALDLEFVDCILEEGEMLYIPPKWWHYVRSLTTCFSVSFLWNLTKNPQ